MRNPPYRTNPYEPTSQNRVGRETENEMSVLRRVRGFDPDERPAAPTNVTLTISVREVKTHLEFRGKVRCDPLTPDTCQADIKTYIFQVRPTDNLGVPIEDENRRTRMVPAKEFFESDATFPHVLFNHLEKPKKYYYVARAAIRDKDDRRSDWSDWTTPQLPFQTGEPKPPAPTGLSLDFDTKDKNRQNRWRAIAEWDEVTNWDVPGGDNESDMHAYACQIQKSSDGFTPDENQKRWIRQIPAKQDSDADTTAQCIRHMIFRRYWYRARVRSIDRFTRRGDWSDWTIWQKPGMEAPPTPLNVLIHEASNDRVVIELDAPSEPTNPDVYHVDVDYFQYEISNSPTFATRYRIDRNHPNEQKSFKIKKDDQNKVFYGRARSMSGDDDPSAWIPATIAGNSNPAANADGVIVGGQGEIYVATFNKPGPVLEKHYDSLWVAPRRLKFKRARARVGRHDPATHPNDGTPSGGNCQVNIWLHSADEESQQKIFDTDDRLKITSGTHKDVNWLSSFNVTHIEENESLSIKVPIANGAKNLVVQILMEPA